MEILLSVCQGCGPYTKTGKEIAFQARSVVGGTYIKALADKHIAEKWQSRARQ